MPLIQEFLILVWLKSICDIYVFVTKIIQSYPIQIYSKELIQVDFMQIYAIYGSLYVLTFHVH